MAQYADRVIKLLDGRVLEDSVNEHPKEIALVRTLEDGSVVELTDDEMAEAYARR